MDRGWVVPVQHGSMAVSVSFAGVEYHYLWARCHQSRWIVIRGIHRCNNVFQRKAGSFCSLVSILLLSAFV